MWQTDFTYFNVKSFGWYYLSTVLDDYSRYIIHWEFGSSMSASAQDVAQSIDQAMLKAGLTHKNAPKLLSDNGPCYIASSLKEHLNIKFNMKHIHGKPLHPQIQGKIERYHESLGNLRPTDVYLGRQELILKIREQLKRALLKQRYQANNLNQQSDISLHL